MTPNHPKDAKYVIVSLLDGGIHYTGEENIANAEKMAIDLTKLRYLPLNMKDQIDALEKVNK